MGSFSLGYSIHDMNKKYSVRMSSFRICLVLFFYFLHFRRWMSLAEDLMWLLPELCVLLVIGTVPGSVYVSVGWALYFNTVPNISFY